MFQLFLPIKWNLELTDLHQIGGGGVCDIINHYYMQKVQPQIHCHTEEHRFLVGFVIEPTWSVGKIGQCVKTCHEGTLSPNRYMTFYLW